MDTTKLLSDSLLRIRSSLSRQRAPAAILAKYYKRLSLKIIESMNAYILNCLDTGCKVYVLIVSTDGGLAGHVLVRV